MVLNTLREMRYRQFIFDWIANLQENREWLKLDTYKITKMTRE